MGGADLLHLYGRPRRARGRARPTRHHVERKVDLPDRWVRGLAEVPLRQRRAMTRRAELSGAAIPRLRPRPAALGVARARRPPPAGAAGRAAAPPGPARLDRGSPGATRLRGMDRGAALRDRRLTVPPTTHGASGLGLRPPGRAAHAGAHRPPLPRVLRRGRAAAPPRPTARARTHGRALLGALGWDPVIDPAALAAATGLDDRAGRAPGSPGSPPPGGSATTWPRTAWFHRELPDRRRAGDPPQPAAASARTSSPRPTASRPDGPARGWCAAARRRAHRARRQRAGPRLHLPLGRQPRRRARTLQARPRRAAHAPPADRSSRQTDRSSRHPAGGVTAVTPGVRSRG